MKLFIYFHFLSQLSFLILFLFLTRRLAHPSPPPSRIPQLATPLSPLLTAPEPPRILAHTPAELPRRGFGNCNTRTNKDY